MNSKSVEFTKMSGSGNDFVIIDNRDNILKDGSSFAKEVCHRKLSVGADGLILIETAAADDFRMRIFNPDGSEPQMCGNGARCAALFAHIKGIVNKKMNFETGAGRIFAEVYASAVKLKLGDPYDIRLGFDLKIGDKTFGASYINTGVPHTVLFVLDIENTDVVGLGRMIRYHRDFEPSGTNVDFVQLKDHSSVIIRTYERGVEDETLACGTGSVASAVIAGLQGNVGLNELVHVHTRGGEILKVHYKIEKQQDFISQVKDVYLEGAVKVAFEGKINL